MPNQNQSFINEDMFENVLILGQKPLFVVIHFENFADFKKTKTRPSQLNIISSCQGPWGHDHVSGFRVI